MNKYKKLAFNTAIFAVGNFGSKILVLLLTKLYTKYISPSEMNTKDLLESLSLALIPIFTFALQEYMIRFGLDKEYDKREIFTTSTVMTMAGMVGMSLTVLIMSPFVDFMKGYTLLLIIYTFMSSFRMLCTQFIRSRDMVKLFSLDGILATLSLFIFSLWFIGHLHWGVKGAMLSVILSDFCSSAFLFVVAKLPNFLNKTYFNKNVARAMLKFSLPLIPTIVMWTITSLSDRLFIRYMHSDRAVLGESAAGLYGVANKIPNLISMVSTIFFQAWNMSAITENDSDDRSEFYEKVYSAYESMLFIAGAGLILLVKPVTNILLVNSENFDEYKKVYLYTPVLIAAVLFTCFDQFLGSIYTATKHTKNSFWTSLVACVVNIILNFCLIPEWGIQGASIATFLSYYVCFWARIIDARYYVPFKFNAGRSLLNTGLLLVMCRIASVHPKLWGFWLFVFCCIIMGMNYKALIATATKLLKRR